MDWVCIATHKKLKERHTNRKYLDEGFSKVYLNLFEGKSGKLFFIGYSEFSVEEWMVGFTIFLRKMSIFQIWKHYQRSVVEEYIAGIIEDIIDESCSRNTSFKHASNKLRYLNVNKMTICAVVCEYVTR